MTSNLNSLSRVIFFWFAFLATLCLFLSGGCVSVKIGENSAPEKNKNVQFSAPPHPFKSFEMAPLDRAWRHEKNGNTISFLSECNKKNEPALEEIHRSFARSISNSEILEESYFQYNQREALRAQIQGRVDGVLTRTDYIVLKKNNCTYIITYAGTETRFKENKKNFDDFINRFVAP